VGVAATGVQISDLHKSGRLNASADALSRLSMRESIFPYGADEKDEKLIDGLLSVSAISLTGLTREDMIKGQFNDPGLKSIVQVCQSNQNQYLDYRLHDGVLYKLNNKQELLLLVPHQLRESILAQYHNHKLSGVHVARFLLYGRDATLPQDVALKLKRPQKAHEDKDSYKLDLLAELYAAYRR
jgi:hypothetical protein